MVKNPPATYIYKMEKLVECKEKEVFLFSSHVFI